MHPGIWLALLLALVQGITEFFPVSSSGHLVMVEALFGMRSEGSAPGVLFEVAVHVGTLGAVILVYRRRLSRLAKAKLSLLLSGRGALPKHEHEIRYLGCLVVGTIPAVLVGALLYDRIVPAFDSPRLVSLFLVMTAAYLLLSRRRFASWNLSWRTALIIGIAQAVAMLPGISRSGWTITTALLLGLAFEEAAEFSFLLSIPAIVCALVLELVREPAALPSGVVLPLVVGALGAFLSGWLALRLLIGILNRGAFHRFAYYLLPVGIVALFHFAL